MRHRVKTKKLGRDAEHRKALFRNIASSLFIHGYIKTTLAKAKAIRPYVEKLVTNARCVIQSSTTKERLKFIRNVTKEISDNNSYNYLIRVWAPLCLERPGGYIRIIKLGVRKGDSAEMAYIGIVIDESILKKYNQSNNGYRNAFKYLSELLMQDIPQPKILLDMWSNCVMPQITTEIKSKNQKNLKVKIKFGDVITDLGIINWPIYNGIYPKLPLFVEIVYSQSTSKKLVFENLNNLIEIPLAYSTNKIKILFSPFKKDQFIEVLLKTTSRRGNLNSMNKCRILVYNPIGLIFYQNIILKEDE